MRVLTRLLVLSAFVFNSVAGNAAVNKCVDMYRRELVPQEQRIADDPIAGLNEILNANPETGLRPILNGQGTGVRAWRTRGNTEDIKLDKEISEGQIRLLVESLFRLRYGEPHKFIRDVLMVRDNQVRHEIYMQRLTEREMAVNGLIRYFSNRDLLASKEKLSTRIKTLLKSNAVEGVLAATTIPAVSSGTPIFRMPNLNLFFATKAELETLILHGIKSPEGQAIVKRTQIQGNTDFRYAISRQAFNRIAFIIGVALITGKIWLDQEEEARKNGELFMEQINNKADNIDSQIEAGPNRDDIEIETQLGKFKEILGRDYTEDDILALCGRYPSAKRCQ